MFWDALNWVGGHLANWLAGAWAAAVAGRLCWHTRMVQRGHRQWISRELLLEIPIVIFTYLIGTGLCEAMGWDGRVAGAVVAGVSYLGPGGIQVIAQRYMRNKFKL